MKTITFYSYKGGVGRTLALANVAMRLSEFNKKVCIMDFDLEAPGLHHKFKQQLKTFEFKNGIVDYIHEFVANDVIPESIKDYVKVIDFNAKNKIPIDFIPAGNSQHNDYWKKLARISWKELFYEEDSEGLPFFLDLKGKIEAQLQPDFLLIDARTGLSEIAGITVSILADHVVVIAANNEENLQGAKMMLDAFSHPENVFFDKAPETTFVLSRIPYPHEPEERQRERFLLEEVRKRMEFEEDKEVLVIHSDRNLEVKESLLIAKDSDTNIPVAQDYLKLFEEITKNDLTETERENYQNVKRAEYFFTTAINNIKDSESKIFLFSAAIKINDKNDEYFLQRGISYLNEKKYAFALKDFNRGISLNPDNYSFYANKALIFYKKNNFADAAENLRAAIKLNPNDFELYLFLGDVQMEMKDYESALKNINIAISLSPDSSKPYNNRANLYMIMGKTEDAFFDIYHSIALNPVDEVAYGTLAELHIKENNFEEFYKNIQLSFLFGSRESVFLNKEIYQPFLKEKRFLDLLDKYNIEIPQTQ